MPATLLKLPPNLPKENHPIGFHNVAGESDGDAGYWSHRFEDAHLTPKGWAQTQLLRYHLDELGHREQIELVVVSPLMRTLETATGIFGVPDPRDALEFIPKTADEDIAAVFDWPELRVRQGQVQAQAQGQVQVRGAAAAAPNSPSPSGPAIYETQGAPRTPAMASAQQGQPGQASAAAASPVILAEARALADPVAADRDRAQPSDRLGSGPLEVPCKLKEAQTALHGVRSSFPSILADRHTPPIIATDICRERLTPHPCDKRRDLHLTKPLFPGVDFDLVEPKDSLWNGRAEEDYDELSARAGKFLEWLEGRPEERIAVVTHGGFMMAVLAHYLRRLHGRNLSPTAVRPPYNAEMKTIVLGFDLSPAEQKGLDFVPLL